MRKQQVATWSTLTREQPAYAASQVCSPTRSSIMCGKYPARTDATNFFTGKRAGKFLPAELVDRMALEEVTVAEALREGGYATCFAGKWHLGPEGFWPTDQGFEENHGGGSNGLPRSFFEPYKNVDNLPPRKEGEYLTRRLADESCGFLERTAGKPFLLYHAFYNVHTPLMAPPELVEKYKKKAEDMGLTQEEGRFDNKRERQVWPSAEQPRTVRVRQDHATYAAMVESMDSAVGQIAAKLEELGLSENTAIFFMSDNGGLSTSEGLPTSNLPLRGGKGWMYEGGVREPVFVKWPGVTKSGSKCAHPIVSTDFYPTMLEMAGLPLRPEQHVDGVSFASLLKNPATKLERDAIFWHYPHYSNQGGIPTSAIRVGDFKLIQDLETGDLELYNLESDLAEQQNVASEHPEKVAQMHKRLKEWRTEVDAKMLRLNPQTGESPPQL